MEKAESEKSLQKALNLFSMTDRERPTICATKSSMMVARKIELQVSKAISPGHLLRRGQKQKLRIRSEESMDFCETHGLDLPCGKCVNDRHEEIAYLKSIEDAMRNHEQASEGLEKS